MRLALLMLAACGTATAIRPPNTEIACDRAIECGSVGGDDRAQCVNCLEHVRDVFKAHENDAPLESIACADLNDFVTSSNLPRCIEELWVWP